MILKRSGQEARKTGIGSSAGRAGQAFGFRAHMTIESVPTAESDCFETNGDDAFAIFLAVCSIAGGISMRREDLRDRLGLMPERGSPAPESPEGRRSATPPPRSTPYVRKPRPGFGQKHPAGRGPARPCELRVHAQQIRPRPQESKLSSPSLTSADVTGLTQFTKMQARPSFVRPEVALFGGSASLGSHAYPRQGRPFTTTGRESLSRAADARARA